jgi:trimeric autotransporter adhesin
MLIVKRKYQILLALATLLSLALAVGCRGFFKDPQLNSITVGPQNATLQQGSTLQMSAIGNFDDGSTNTLNKGVLWTSDDTSVAPIGATGIVTGAAPGTATISASSGAITGTTTINIALNNVTAIMISPNAQNVFAGGTTTYTALATVSGGPQVDVTASATWTATNGAGTTETTISFSPQTSPVTVTTTSATPPGTYTITATYVANSQTFTDTATLTVQ